MKKASTSAASGPREGGTTAAAVGTAEVIKLSAPRISQRAPTSCSFCYRRKIKCDRNFPCGNCIRRSQPESCVRETVVVRGELVTGPAKTERVPLSADELRALSEAQLRSEVSSLRKRLAEQERLNASYKQAQPDPVVNPVIPAHPGPSIGSANSEGSPVAASSTFRPSDPHSYGCGALSPAVSPKASGSGSVPPTFGRVQEGNDDDGDVLKPYLQHLNLPMGPSTGTLAGKQNGTSSSGINSSTLNRPRVFLSPLSTTIKADTSLLSLVPLHHSYYLVKNSLKYTDWIHGVVHVPTYLAEHKQWIEDVKRGTAVVKDEYLALYFAIIASGLYFVDAALGSPIGLSSNDIATLPTLWFEACLESLNRSNFLSVPMIESLQTICILPMISHTFGATAYVDSLLHCGLRIAQSLHLHLLGPEDEGAPRKGIIDREIGRRIWMLLTIAESHTDEAIPHALFLPTAITADPANVNDEDLQEGYPLIPRPLAETTLTSHIRAIAARAKVFRGFTARYYACSSVEEQYRVMIDTDHQLLHILHDFPALAPRVDAYPTSIDVNAPFDYLPMSRFFWALAIPPTRIILYKSFLGRAYTDRRFADVRQICLEAAKQVLLERRRPVPALYQRPWPVSAFTVLAGVVLLTEYVHGRCTPEVRAQLYSDIQEIISILPLPGANNKVVERGVELLTRVLGDAVRNEVELAPVEAMWPAVDEWTWMTPVEPVPDLWTNALKSFDAPLNAGTSGAQDPWVGETWWLA